MTFLHVRRPGHCPENGATELNNRTCLGIGVYLWMVSIKYKTRIETLSGPLVEIINRDDDVCNEMIHNKLNTYTQRISICRFCNLDHTARVHHPNNVFTILNVT